MRATLEALGDHARAILFEGIEPLVDKGKLHRALGFVRAALLFRGVEAGPRLCALGPLRVANEGRMIIGARVTFLGGMLQTEVITHPG